MQKYLQYRVEDFIWDQPFRQWVLTPTRETDARWRQWIAKNPDKVSLVEEARDVILALQLRELPLSDQEIQYATQRAVAQTHQQASFPDQTPDSPVKIIPFYRQTWVRVAASLLLLMGLGLWLWTNQFNNNAGSSQQALIQYNQLVAGQEQALAETVNQTPHVMPVRLQDGSLVLLKPGSRLSYSPAFTGTTRDVYLSGEAFFEVTKNPDKPFLIYANGLVTKVLGTSFLIRAYPKEPDVVVEVKTGRVAVFAQTDPDQDKKISNRELTGIVLIPNQKIVFEREGARLAKSLISNPQLLPGATRQNPFVFDDTPIPAVFAALEQAYGVDIVYDESALANCPLTAELVSQPLFEKLDIICRVIEARYEVVDGKIVVSGRGCKP